MEYKNIASFNLRCRLTDIDSDFKYMKHTKKYKKARSRHEGIKRARAFIKLLKGREFHAVKQNFSTLLIGY